ncbi:MAG: hypothetical protein KIT10_14395 [Flavobacteriales bacterium]|nr:hypothetical protein [Flavobacteriales bacterium]
MRTKSFFKHLMLGALLLTTGKVAGQVTTANNVANAGTDFLGWDNTFPANNFPLRVRHDLNQPIEWYTAAVRLLLLLQNATYAIGPFGGQVKNGALLLSPDVDQFYGNGAPGPYSLLHLAAANNNAQQDSYRPWMNTGITFTGNDDQGYIGQKAGELDYTDLVIHWSDNPNGSPWVVDRIVRVGNN